MVRAQKSVRLGGGADGVLASAEWCRASVMKMIWVGAMSAPNRT
jgi:hypothetical protein